MYLTRFAVSTLLVAYFTTLAVSYANAQSTNFVTPSTGDVRFGFDRSGPGTTYAEWFRFERTGGGGSPGNIPDDSPEAFSGFAAGGASFDGNTTSVTGGGTIINGTEFSASIPGIDLGLGAPTIVAVQVDFSSNIDDSIFAADERDPFGDPLAVIPAADPALDTATPQFIDSSPLLSSPTVTDLAPTDVIELARFYDLAGRGGVVPTLFTTSLFIFELADSEADYTISFDVEAGTGVRSAAVDTFSVPEPACVTLVGLALTSLFAVRRR